MSSRDQRNSKKVSYPVDTLTKEFTSLFLEKALYNIVSLFLGRQPFTISESKRAYVKFILPPKQRVYHEEPPTNPRATFRLQKTPMSLTLPRYSCLCRFGVYYETLSARRDGITDDDYDWIETNDGCKCKDPYLSNNTYTNFKKCKTEGCHQITVFGNSGNGMQCIECTQKRYLREDPSGRKELILAGKLPVPLRSNDNGTLQDIYFSKTLFEAYKLLEVCIGLKQNIVLIVSEYI
jgi:hypothetical protein